MPRPSWKLETDTDAFRFKFDADTYEASARGGGKGNGKGGPKTEPAPEPDPSPTPTEPTTDTGPELSAVEAEILRLINEYRAEKLGADAVLTNDPRLNAAADDWSETMAKSDFFKHSSYYAQTAEFGYESEYVREIAGAGYGGSAQAVFDAWKASSGHNAVMLTANVEDIGVGHYYLANDSGSVNYSHYFTVHFAVEADLIG
jgi:uncharacterized protein YkwD